MIIAVINKELEPKEEVFTVCIKSDNMWKPLSRHLGRERSETAAWAYENFIFPDNEITIIKGYV